MKRIEYLKRHLKQGAVYRREDLNAWSHSVDRHLQQLVKEGLLTKVSGGLYYVPEETILGKAPADTNSLIKAFLKDDRFVVVSPSLYNTLGVGTTQLYNERRVYNLKRHGTFKLGNRTFNFIRKNYVPRKVTREFLLVEMMNNLRELAEDQPNLINNIRKAAKMMNRRSLLHLARYFGSVATRKFFSEILNDGS